MNEEIQKLLAACPKLVVDTQLLLEINALLQGDQYFFTPPIVKLRILDKLSVYVETAKAEAAQQEKRATS